MNNQEGYIKFKYEWDKKPFLFPGKQLEMVNHWRQKLYHMDMIGVYDNGIGFGNLSIRIDQTNDFIITGSATGKYKQLNKMHYALVDYFDIENNFVRCIGETKASSESLTHAAVYMEAESVGAVIHTHNRAMWNYYKDEKPTTSTDAPFGTPEIANEIRELVKKNVVLREKIIVMGGHEDGIITFGEDIHEAGRALLDYYYKVTDQKTK